VFRHIGELHESNIAETETETAAKTARSAGNRLADKRAADNARLV